MTLDRKYPTPPAKPVFANGNEVLLVDDSQAIALLLREYCEMIAEVRAVVANSLVEVKAQLEVDPERFFLAIVDLNLPDAPNGEAVDLLLARGLPVVVLTSHVDETVREHLLSRNVVDYLLKSSMHEIDHAASLVRRIYRNRFIKVLVVDDSRAFREYVGQLLELQHLQVRYAENGRDALRVMASEPGFDLVITDYNMPEMDGLALIDRLRQHHGRAELAIIGVSKAGSSALSARLLKHGANDFISKPFLIEEFYCRVTQNIELIEQMRAIRELALRDYLTGLYNRRYLFEAGELLYANAQRLQLTLAAVMLDIDHFKRINDTHGHLAGDRVLKQVASILATGLRQTDLIGRYGGEEFCLLLTGLDHEGLAEAMERLRAAVADASLDHKDQRLSVTISLGASMDLTGSLQAMIDRADAGLYQAKANGRNRSVIAPPA